MFYNRQNKEYPIHSERQHKALLHKCLLDHGSSLKILNCFLAELRVNVVSAEPGDDINTGWKVSVCFVVVLKRLGFIL